MASLRLLPFQLHMTLRVALLVLVLTASFLWVVLDKVQEQIEMEGRENFRLLSTSAFGEADAVMDRYLKLLDRLRDTLPLLPDPASKTTRTLLARMVLPYEDATSLFVTRASGDISYALRVDGEAPLGSAYTIGHIATDAEGRRWGDITYLSADHIELQQRRIDATEVPPSPWYAQAIRYDRFATPIVTFPGGPQGLSLFASLPGNTVVGVSMSVALLDRMLDRLLDRLPISGRGTALLLDDQQRVVATRFRGNIWSTLGGADVRLKSVTEIAPPVLATAMAAMDARTELKVGAKSTATVQRVTLENADYLMTWHQVLALPGMGYRMVLLAPMDELTMATAGARQTTWLLALIGLGVVLPLTWIGAGVTARRLQDLVRTSERITRMDFTPAPLLKTGVRELHQLAQAQDTMRAGLQARTHALEQVSDQLAALINTGAALVHETDRERLLQAVLAAASDVTRAQAAMLFVRDDQRRLQVVATSGINQADVPPLLDLDDGQLQRTSMAVHVALSGEPFVVDDAEHDPREQLTAWRQTCTRSQFQTQSVACLPLRAPDGQVIGVMQLINARDAEGRTVPFNTDLLRYSQALAAQAAVALDKHKLIDAQRQLLDSLVQILCDAIDAKSPYTGRHCVRVPELALMLAQEAHATNAGPLGAFRFETEAQWREFRIGAWLHDCGKITSPEHVIDKATRLEMVYNRLHEVRMRFEVLLRDAHIHALESVLQGRTTQQQADAEYAQQAALLAQDFAFLAACNQGPETMTEDDMARVENIGRQRWLRHFDDRIGLSWQELALRGDAPAPALPTLEPLLADQPWHRVPREPGEADALTEGFKMHLPAYAYDHGELHNLCLPRGTLTEEERFKVNEHIIHTIRMLENANFPAPFSRVPEYAGTHHETLDGLGYPRGLSAAELSVPARIMTIADIFEALTAKDRPYKQGKPLSEVVAILHRLVQRGKIDGDLFALFLRSGIHLRYAQRFLAPEQIDQVDVEAVLGAPPARPSSPEKLA